MQTNCSASFTITFVAGDVACNRKGNRNQFYLKTTSRGTTNQICYRNAILSDDQSTQITSSIVVAPFVGITRFPASYSKRNCAICTSRSVDIRDGTCNLDFGQYRNQCTTSDSVVLTIGYGYGIITRCYIAEALGSQIIGTPLVSIRPDTSCCLQAYATIGLAKTSFGNSQVNLQALYNWRTHGGCTIGIVGYRHTILTGSPQIADVFGCSRKVIRTSPAELIRSNTSRNGDVYCAIGCILVKINWINRSNAYTLLGRNSHRSSKCTTLRICNCIGITTSRYVAQLNGSGVVCPLVSIWRRATSSGNCSWTSRSSITLGRLSGSTGIECRSRLRHCRWIGYSSTTVGIGYCECIITGCYIRRICNCCEASAPGIGQRCGTTRNCCS